MVINPTSVLSGPTGYAEASLLGKNSKSKRRKMNALECPYIADSDAMCNVLVNEVTKAQTWSRIEDAIHAIQKVRSEEKHHVSEWEHLNNPSPQNCKPNAPHDGRGTRTVDGVVGNLDSGGDTDG